MKQLQYQRVLQLLVLQHDEVGDDQTFLVMILLKIETPTDVPEHDVK